MADSDREEIAKLETLFAAHPEGRIFTHLAEAYRKAGELDRAREVLQKGLERHADYSSAYVVLGRVQAAQGDAGAARASFRKVLELDAHNLVALRALGDLARDAGDAEEALGFYQQLQGAEPGNDALQEQIASLTVQVDAAREQAAVEEAAAAAASQEEAAKVSHVEPIDLNFGGGADQAEDEGGFLSLEAPDVSTLDLSGMTFAASEDLPPESVPDVAPEDEQEPAPEQHADAAGEPETEPGPVLDHGLDSLAEMPALEFTTGDPEVEPASGAETATPAEEEQAPAEAGTADYAAEPAEQSSYEEPVVVTETIADLFLQQGLRERAAEVYRRLLTERPGDAELERKLAEAERQGTVPAEDQPAAESVPDLDSLDFQVERNEFELEPDIPDEPATPPAAADQLMTEEQEQEEILSSIQPDPVVASSMEGYFEELFGQIPAESGAQETPSEAQEAESAAPAGSGTGFTTESERSFFMTDAAEDEAPAVDLAAPEVADGAAPVSDPWIEAAAEDEQVEEPSLERIESAWTGGAGALGTEPTPYAWDARDSGQEEAEPEESVEEYFRSLLSWKPRTQVTDTAVEPLEDSQVDSGDSVEDDAVEEDRDASAAFEAALISPNQPTDTRPEPPAEAPVAQEPDEIDALFSDAPAPSPLPAAERVAAAPAGTGGEAARDAASADEGGAADEEEDLEVFRAWLQSLKH